MFDTIQVGSASAGSDPGPAAYDRGGMNPTVTDADLVLGYLDPERYADGKIKLNPRRSYQALEDICDELDIDEIDAAKLWSLLTFVDTYFKLYEEEAHDMKIITQKN